MTSHRLEDVDSPRMVLDEEAMATGVGLHAAVALHSLRRESREHRDLMHAVTDYRDHRATILFLPPAAVVSNVKKVIAAA